MTMKTFINNTFRVVIFLFMAATFIACEEEETFGPPVADFEVSGILKAYDTLTFINNSQNATSFLWHFGNGETVFEKEPTFLFTSPGTYSITLQAEGAGGRSVVTQQIIIGPGVPLPTAAFSIQNVGALLDGVPIVFANESEFGATYLWEFGDAANSKSIEKNPIFTYSAAGDYTVKLTTTNEKGSDSHTMTLTILQANLGSIFFVQNDLTNNKFYIKKVNVRTKTVSNVFEIPGFGFGIEYDPIKELLYYTDDDNAKIYSNNLNGTSQVEIAGSFSSVHDLALDYESGYLYVTDRTANRLGEIRLSDKRVSTMYDNAVDGLGKSPEGVTYANDQLYITCVAVDAESVWKGNVFGDGVSRIVDYDAGGFGYGIAVDAVNSKIYFDDNDGKKIRRANLDGTDVEVVTTTSDRVYGMDVDSEFGKLYWSDRKGNVYGGNIDGTGVEILVAGFGDIRGIILVK